TQYLRFIKDHHIDLVHATTEPHRPSTKHDHRPVSESDPLLTIRQPNIPNVLSHARATNHALHRHQRVISRRQMLRRPHCPQASEAHTQSADYMPHGESLTDVTGDTLNHTTNSGSELAILVHPERDHPQTALPLIEPHTHRPKAFLNVRIHRPLK